MAKSLTFLADAVAGTTAELSGEELLISRQRALEAAAEVAAQHEKELSIRFTKYLNNLQPTPIVSGKKGVNVKFADLNSPHHKGRAIFCIEVIGRKNRQQKFAELAKAKQILSTDPNLAIVIETVTRFWVMLKQDATSAQILAPITASTKKAVEAVLTDGTK